jgi:hypothetical protein
MPGARFHNQDLPAFQEFHHGRARDPDQRSARTWAAQIHGAFEFPGINQVEHMGPMNVQNASQNVDRETFTRRQVFAHVHGGNI